MLETNLEGGITMTNLLKQAKKLHKPRTKAVLKLVRKINARKVKIEYVWNRGY